MFLNEVLTTLNGVFIRGRGKGAVCPLYRFLPASMQCRRRVLVRKALHWHRVFATMWALTHIRGTFVLAGRITISGRVPYALYSNYRIAKALRINCCTLE